jgi:hypothetical protein
MIKGKWKVEVISTVDRGKSVAIWEWAGEAWFYVAGQRIAADTDADRLVSEVMSRLSVKRGAR